MEPDLVTNGGGVSPYAAARGEVARWWQAGRGAEAAGVGVSEHCTVMVNVDTASARPEDGQ
jgi:hypothetical protein